MEESKLEQNDTGTAIEKNELPHDDDDAMKAHLLFVEKGLVLDDKSAKRIRMRADMIIMPLISMLYAMQFVDYALIPLSSIMGILEDCHLDGSQYSWINSIFYFGFLCLEIPTGLILQKVPVAKYLAVSCILWGVCEACLAACTNFTGLMIARFFLGALEACVAPGLTLIVNRWYTTKEQSFRYSIFLSFLDIGGLMAYFWAYGLVHNSLGVHYGISPWRIILIIGGVFTSLLGVALFFVVPDNQLNTWWLNPDDRLIAVERIRINQQGIGNRHFKWKQFWEVWRDPFTYMACLSYILMAIPAGGINSYSNIVVESLGYDEQETLLLGTPAIGIGFLAIIGWGYVTQRWGYWILNGLVGCVLAIAGILMLSFAPQPLAKLFGYYLVLALNAQITCYVGLVGTNVAGYTKKTTLLSAFWACYAVGNIIGPQTFQAKDAPGYLPAKLTVLFCIAGGGILLLLMWAWFARQNKKKAQLRAAPGYVKKDGIEFEDLTDWENPEFVYKI